MNDHVRIAIASQKRIEEGIANKKKRQKKARESYRCYLAYMKYKTLL